ncbi:MAG: hypothetical protein HFI70_12565 [Lachnospiraceae bacterium]|nr:hypothetical protein [Lachnospiraceae bacterium]
MKKAAAIGNVMFIYLAALLPVLLFSNGKSRFVSFLWEKIFSNNIFIPLLLFLIFGAVMYIINMLLFLQARRGRWNALELARINMIAKLVQIPAYLFIFIVGLFCMVMIFTIGVSAVFLLLDVLSVGMTGVYALAVFYQLRKEQFISAKMQIVYSLISFVFCVDVITSVRGYQLCARAGQES